MADTAPANQPSKPLVVSDEVEVLTRNQRLWRLFRVYLKPFGWGAVFLVVTNYLALRIPRELGQSIQLLEDAAKGERTLVEVAGLIPGHATAIILLAVGAMVARILSRIGIFNVGRMIEYDLRNQLFDHLTRLSPSYYQSIATGDLTSRVVNDTTYIRLLFGLGFLHSVNTLVAVILAVGLMFGLDWQLTLYCLLPFPIVLYVVMRLARALHVRTLRVQESLAELSSQCQEDLSGIGVIKAYAIEDVEAERFAGRCETYVQKNLSLARVRSLLFPLMLSIGSLGTLLVIYLGGRAVIVDRTINTGQFIEFSGYIAMLAWPFMAMGWVLSVWQRGTAAFDRLTEILATTPDIQAPDALPTGNPVRSGRIEFRDVSFRYGDDGPPILEDVNLVIESGQRVGIVGRSGSGKSTLVNLIPRLYDVSAGEIRVDDQPVQTIPLRYLRGAVGYAPQEPFLFSTTLEKNIRMGLDAHRYEAGQQGSNGEADTAVHNVIDAVNLGQDLETFPKGLDTMVGERGITLSGGQKQRVALARAMLVTPQILILDDSLSSVDTRTERAILDHLDELMADRTAIVVTHRFGVLELLDEVIVLEDGHLVERGTHTELMSVPDGVYARMVKRQKLREELSEL